MKRFSVSAAFFVAGLAVAAPHIASAQATPEGKKIVKALTEDSEARKTKAAIPKNMARWHMGAGLWAREGSGGWKAIAHADSETIPAGILLGEDETVGYQLEAGETSVVVGFQEPRPISRFFVNSFDAEGEVRLEYGNALYKPDSRKWKPLSRRIHLVPDQVVYADFAITEFRYLKITFDTPGGGEIGSLGAIGVVTLHDVNFTRPEPAALTAPPDERVSFDYAKVYAGSAITHVSSGGLEGVHNMIDDDLETGYKFPATDADPVLVLDLAETTQFDRLSMNVKVGPGRMEIYLFAELPEALKPDDDQEAETVTNLIAANDVVKARAAEIGRATRQARSVELDQNFFDDYTPGDVVVVEKPETRIHVQLAVADSRYVLLRWLPEPGSREPLNGDGVLEIYEISVLGMVTPESSVLGVNPGFSFQPALAGGGGVPSSTPPSTPQIPTPPVVSP